MSNELHGIIGPPSITIIRTDKGDGTTEHITSPRDVSNTIRRIAATIGALQSDIEAALRAGAIVENHFAYYEQAPARAAKGE